MKLEYSELENGIRMLKLAGRLDITGTGEIETKFTGHCAGDNVRVVVDLSGVDYLASIGIRLLMTVVKSLNSRNGKMVLLNPTPDVRNVLEITGVPSVIPVYSQMESAEAVLLGA